jgi:hypothetical protein
VRSVQSNSRAQKLLSYAAPALTRLIGCRADPTNDLRITNCSRQGGDLLVIQGRNLGDVGAQVFVGSKLCPVQPWPASNPHREIACLVPSGTGDLRTVVLVQKNGRISADSGAGVSYQPCSPGTSAKDLQCIPCLSGTESVTGVRGFYDPD